jgi:hypothetical protein
VPRWCQKQPVLAGCPQERTRLYGQVGQVGQLHGLTPKQRTKRLTHARVRGAVEHMSSAANGRQRCYNDRYGLALPLAPAHKHVHCALHSTAASRAKKPDSPRCATTRILAS